MRTAWPSSRSCASVHAFLYAFEGLAVHEPNQRLIVAFYKHDMPRSKRMAADQRDLDESGLFFLIDVVAHGMPFAEVAGFLNRTESEVRERWKLVARPIPPRRRLAWPARRRMAH
jgi:hypothetical protein